MATTLFDLEGTVTLNSEGFFTSAETINTKIEDIATAVGNLETKLSGVKISSILDSATFTAEQVVVTGGLEALAEKVGSIREKLTAFDLGGTLLSAVTGGVAALAGNLLIGDIKVGVDVPTTDDIDTAVAPAITHIESLAPAIGITLPDATVDPLATDILNAGTAIADALDAACAWSVPAPSMPSVFDTANKIKVFWQIVTSNLNLSVDAVVNLVPNVIPIDAATGGVLPTGGGGAASSGNWFDDIGAGFEAFGNWAENAAWDFNNFMNENVSTPVQEFLGIDPKDVDLNNLGASSETPASSLETAMFSALSRWAQPIGEDKFAGVIAPKVSNTIARSTRGSRG